VLTASLEEKVERLRRRQFLLRAGLITASTLLVPATTARPARAASERTADILIVGGGIGGVAAALAALQLGRTVILTEETDWLGGQLSAQAVPLDEHPWIEDIGCSRQYRRFRAALRDYYRANLALRDEARTHPRLNPGDAKWSCLAHEPAIAHAVIMALLAPFVARGQLTILAGQRPVAVERQGDWLRAVTVADIASGAQTVLQAAIMLDATPLGDLLDLGQVEHTIGAESRGQTAEPHALAGVADPRDQQAITWGAALDYRPGEDYTIARPADYAFWKGYRATFWPDLQLSWTTPNPVTQAPLHHTLFAQSTDGGQAGVLWQYRRVRSARNFRDGSGDASIVNWPQNDYWLGPLLGVDATERQQHLDRARQLTLSLIYWLQTEAPRPDEGYGYRGLRLRPDITGTADGLAKAPYIREGRRIRAEFTVLEQHLGVAARTQYGYDPQRATPFADSVGIGSYRIDLHPSAAGRGYLDLDALPFQIPLGALIPVRVENLLPAGKALGTTHITNGCFRLHHVEWATGEAAGALAAFALTSGATTRQVRNSPARLANFQNVLQQQFGVPLSWPKAMPAFKDVGPMTPRAGAIWMLVDRGIARGYGDGTFGPTDTLLRAQLAALLCRAAGWEQEQRPNPFHDQGDTDADLWRDVGALAYYGVAKGYADGRFDPAGLALAAQAISFITRTMVERGWWTLQADDPAVYPNLPATSGHRQDLVTFTFYTGGLPDWPTSQPWPEWDQPARRGWFAQALNLALRSRPGG
jgi:hypothetical protein